MVGWLERAMKIAPLILLLTFVLFTSCTQPSRSSASTDSKALAADSVVALNTQDYTKAQKLAAEATRLDPEFAEAWVGYGMASVKLGQTDRARKAYERALSLHQARLHQNPSDSDQVFQQIFLLALLGRSDEAESLLRRAHSDYPSDRQISTLAGDFPAAKRGWESWSVKTK
jgi:Flp pilus assembly protein TadD